MGKEREPEQGELPYRFRGGKRDGAGRKPKGERAGVSHLARSHVNGREPVHVGLRLQRGLPDLQRRKAFAAVEKAFEAAAARRDDFRVTHYSVQGNHLHLIVEAENGSALSRGMQGLCIRLARAINRLAKRTGKVFADRFWSRLLKTPREVRHAIAYVLGNSRKHAERMGLWITLPAADPFAAGPGQDRPGLEAPRTWLLRVGWTRAPAPRAALDVPF
ncbi:transposase [Vulgatibacter sp.]|uniref:transposase n=1 Tax=Vulgatibacter sp. TaxID=1971226 RepID=UPI00356758F9